MKILKKIFLVLLVVLGLIQFIQPGRNESNTMPEKDVTRTVSVPGTVYELLKMSCYDCHSNNTNYPWYAKVQPFGWLLANHIKHGKAELNFNEFGSYSPRRQISKMNGIANSLKDETMPLSSYTMMHKKARLSDTARSILIEWALRTKDSLSMNK